jgi:hypothetical protein
MNELIGTVIEPKESVSDNVISLNSPKYKYAGMKMVEMSKNAYGFTPKSMMMNENEERLGIKSIEDELGWEFTALRKLTSELPLEYRFINPNPVGWMRLGQDVPTMSMVHAWWLDLMYVLSQTVPDIAKRYFIRLDDFYSGDENDLRKFRKELKKRLKKVNLKKVRNLSSKSPEDMTQTEMMKLSRLHNQISENRFWGVIGKSIGIQYVINHIMNPELIEHLMCTHTISEVSIPLFASSILGEEWRTKETSETKELFGQVGDACTVFGAILFNSMKEGITKDEIEEIVNTKSMRSYFDPNVREFLAEHLFYCSSSEGGVGIPIFSADPD